MNEIKQVKSLVKLTHILELQKEMQVFNSKKRPGILDPNNAHPGARVRAAMYYWNCMTAEFTELKDGIMEGDEENIKEELVDILHFMASILVYLEIKPKYKLEHYFQMGNDFYEIDDVENEDSLWSGMTYAWGVILNALPYKNWKTYESYDIIHTEEMNRSADYLLMYFCAMCKLRRMDADELYERYLAKNQENIERQLPGGKYEV